MVYTESIRNILQRIHNFMFVAYNKGCRGGYPSRPAWHVGLGLAAYAGVLELGQLIVPGRNAAFIDWAAGIVGAFAGCLLVMGWRAIQRSLQNAN